MVNILQNVDSKILLFLDEAFDYYLFVFTRNNGCEDFRNIYTAVECDFFTFILNENLAQGFWKMEVYGQNDYSNLHTGNATFLYEGPLRVNPTNVGSNVNNAYIISEDEDYLIT